MILSDFLSRQRVVRVNPHKVIPILFDMKAILKDKYYNVGNEGRYLVQTHSNQRQRNKITRSTQCRQRYKSFYKTRMVSAKIPEVSR